MDKEYRGMQRLAHLSLFDKHCSAGYQLTDESYVIVGNIVDPKSAGIEEAVGDEESVVKIPKDPLEQLKVEKLKKPP